MEHHIHMYIYKYIQTHYYIFASIYLPVHIHPPINIYIYNHLYIFGIYTYDIHTFTLSTHLYNQSVPQATPTSPGSTRDDESSE